MKAFNGEDQALHFLRTDIVLYRIDVCIRSCFRAGSSDKGKSDFIVKSPDLCNTYMREEVTKVVTHLSNPAKVLEDTAKYLHDIEVARGKKGSADLWSPRGN